MQKARDISNNSLRSAISDELKKRIMYMGNCRQLIGVTLNKRRRLKSNLIFRQNKFLLVVGKKYTSWKYGTALNHADIC